VGEADQRAEVGVFVFRVADADARNALDDLGFERGFQVLGTNTRVPLVQT
jgi:predicted Zn-dependent protease with MMP-like domain